MRCRKRQGLRLRASTIFINPFFLGDKGSRKGIKMENMNAVVKAFEAFFKKCHREAYQEAAVFNTGRENGQKSFCLE